MFTKEDSYCRWRWWQVQYLDNLFWKKEYIPLLQECQKWNQERKNLAPGDIVHIVDEISPRNSWLMGKVEETMPDSRGHVCKVTVKTKYSILERLISKLCLLKEADWLTSTCLDWPLHTLHTHTLLAFVDYASIFLTLLSCRCNTLMDYTCPCVFTVKVM